MTVAFWTLAQLALWLAVWSWLQAVRVSRYYRPIDSDALHDRPPLSLVVAVRAAGPDLPSALGRSVGALRPGDELLIAVDARDATAVADAEAGAAAATAVARRVPTDGRGPARVEVVRAHPPTPSPSTDPEHASDARVAALRAAAVERAAHRLLAFVEDDVALAAPTLDEVVRTAANDGVGAAFALPYVAAGARGRSAWRAAFANQWKTPALAALALRGAPRFVAEGLWATTRAAWLAAEAADPGGTRAALGLTPAEVRRGAAFHATGRRNRVVRRMLPRSPAPVPGAAGPGRDGVPVAGWRAGGPLGHALAALGANPVPLGLAATLIGLTTQAVPAAVAFVPAVAAMGWRMAALATLNGGPYRGLPRHAYLGRALALEALAWTWWWSRPRAADRGG